MTKDEADAILDLARQLMEEDVSVERRCRLAKKIITHARAIRAVCMVEPQIEVVLKPFSRQEVLQGGVVLHMPAMTAQEKALDQAIEKMQSCIGEAWAQPLNFGGYAGFSPVLIKLSDWLNPAPEHEGELIIWADGSAHTMPEADTEYVTVLRRFEVADDQESRKTANACMMRFPYVWGANRETMHVPPNYG